MPNLGTYVKAHPETGRDMERTPDTPAEVVALEFDGWRKKETRKGGSTSSSAGSSKSTGPSS